MQAAAALDVGEARRLGRDEPIAQAELLAERDRLGFLNQQRVGAAVDREAVDCFADDDAAGARRAFEHHERDAAARELVGGGETRDAAADDDDVDADAVGRALVIALEQISTIRAYRQHRDSTEPVA